jgi:hypothetical protein
MHKRTIPHSANEQQSQGSLSRLNTNVPQHVAEAVRIKAITERRPLWAVISFAIAQYCGISVTPPTGRPQTVPTRLRAKNPKYKRVVKTLRPGAKKQPITEAAGV